MSDDGKYDDFAKYPESLAEVRANKKHSSREWTPRDALISVLRDIDSGEIKPRALVVCFIENTEDGGIKPHFSVSADNFMDIIGTVELAKHRLFEVAWKDDD